jgi:hypothetical protein
LCVCAACTHPAPLYTCRLQTWAIYGEMSAAIMCAERCRGGVSGGGSGGRGACRQSSCMQLSMQCMHPCCVHAFWALNVLGMQLRVRSAQKKAGESGRGRCGRRECFGADLAGKLAKSMQLGMRFVHLGRVHACSAFGPPGMGTQGRYGEIRAPNRALGCTKCWV